MGRFEQRIERLEQRMGVKPGSRLIYFTNLQEEEPEETPYLIKVSADIWAHVFGAPLNQEEIRDLRQEYAEKIQNEFEAADRPRRRSSNIERGKENPTLDLLLGLADALKVSLGELCDFEDIDQRKLQKSIREILKVKDQTRLRTALKVLRAILR